MKQNINIGGTKGRMRIPENVRCRWKVLDAEGNPDYHYDLNSGCPFPFDGKSVDNYYTSETLEHVKPEFISFVFSEISRTLRDGGLIRIVVPDVAIAVRKYVNGNYNWLCRYNSAHAPFFPKTPLGDLMTWFYSSVKHKREGGRSGHHMAYDEETLKWYLQKSHFKDIMVRKYNDCSPVFEGLDFLRYKETGLYMEARK